MTPNSDFWPYTQDSSWLIEQEGFDPSREREIESLFSIGNGYLGVRGASAFTLPTSQADLFVAGVYDKRAGILPYSEVELLSDQARNYPYTEIVPFPSPFSFKINVEEKALLLGSPDLKSHTRRLDLLQGIYFETFEFEDEKGRSTQIRTLRYVSLINRHLLFQEIEVICKNHSSTITLEFAASHSQDTYPHLEYQECLSNSGIAKHWCYETRTSKIRCNVWHRIWNDSIEVTRPQFTVQAKPGKKIRIKHVVLVSTNKDTNLLEKESIDYLLQLDWNQTDHHFEAHTSSWQEFWNSLDVHLENRPELLQAQRFNCYHLRITADHDSRVSIGAKALTGRAYEGHVFWDTEIFMFPFYLYTDPDIAKHLLLYRYHTLQGAKKRAIALGYSGACYAWESTVTGEDVTPQRILIKESRQEIPIFTGTQQLHITADVAYAVWNYWNATLDSDFLANYGVEILVETARFWKSRLTAVGEHLHLRGVVGPDEYHYGVDDNAFTNQMVRFNLETAVNAVHWLRNHNLEMATEVFQRLKITDGEFESWRTAARNLHQPRVNSQGVIEQFDGFFELEQVDPSENGGIKAPASRLIRWQEANSIQLIKQADVLMIPFLFPGLLSQAGVLANYQYYEPKTDHGSSLSLCVHAAIAAQSGLREQAQVYWEKSLNFDLLNTMNNTALGTHIGCMGGTWQALIFHLLGVVFSENGITLKNSRAPILPSKCDKIQFKLYYRGKQHIVRVLSEGRVAA